MGGRGKLIHPLHTADLEEANRQKWRIVAAMKDDIERARKALAADDPVEAEALMDRLRFSRYGQDDERLIERHEEIGATSSWQDASRYLELARGISTPLDFHQAPFLSYKAGYRAKTVQDFERALGWLRDWMGSIGKDPYIEDVDRRLAGHFIEQFLLVGRGRDKAAAYLGFLREYWKWLKMRGHATENPWVDQDLPNRPRPPRNAEPDGGKRPYHDEEIARLLSGDTVVYLHDLMRVAALSGMRIEEICQLKVNDCESGVFSVTQGKTHNARRIVPIHRDLLTIVAKRIRNARPTDYLFHELPDPPSSRETRSDPASKRFTRYRRQVGVDERPNGKAKSNVDFHSFRRWFIKKARDGLDKGNGGYSPWTIADVVGHDDDGIRKVLKLTMSHYPGPSTESARRSVVDAVQLPRLNDPAD